MAYLLNESGGNALESILLSREIVAVSAVNYAEVLLKLDQYGIDRKPFEFIIEHQLKVISFTQKAAFLAASFNIPKSRPLSLGDRACLGTAQGFRCVVITADRAWKDLGLDLDIQLIR